MYFWDTNLLLKGINVSSQQKEPSYSKYYIDHEIAR